jgi:integrase/recombinase XerD
MTALRLAVVDYLRLRRSLGFGLVRHEKLLNQFVDWLAEQGTVTVTVDAALAWASLPGGSASWPGLRMLVVRGFADYLHTLDPSVQVPPPDLLPGRSRRAVPYLYSGADVAALLAQATRLRTPLRVSTIQTLIGLLSVTGMRIGEVVALDDTDFDPIGGLLTVRHAKTGRQRLVPLHPSTVDALTGYRVQRQSVFPRPACDALLLSSAGTRLTVIGAGAVFTKLARRAGLEPRSGGCRPRPHDLRHTFAVDTLLGWYRDGGDVAARLPLLSTYLGHTEPANTYWYLSAAPELLAEAARRLDDTRR